MKDPFLIIGYMLLGLMLSFEMNAQPSIYEIKKHIQDEPFDFVQMKQDAEAYKILLFRERERRLQFVEIDKYPTPQERRRYYILHAIDVSMTIWALNNRDNIREGNIFLSDNPSNQTLITNKLLAIPIYQNSNQPQVVVMNYITSTVILHNLYVINKYD
tara:strand:+ start:4751 stop:5227 length:477 start_codon:yes stop_codon:yes gene_type:complete